MLMVSCLLTAYDLLTTDYRLAASVDCLLPLQSGPDRSGRLTAFCLPRPYTRGPCGGRGGIAESMSFRTPMTINKIGQVLLMPHSGTNSSIRKMTPIVMRMTGTVKLGLLEIGVLGG